MSGALTEIAPGQWRLEGEITPSNVVAIRARGEQLLGQASRVEVDLSGLTRSTSVTISLMLCWRRHASGLGGEVVFAGWPEALRNIAAVSDIDGVLA